MRHPLALALVGALVAGLTATAALALDDDGRSPDDRPSPTSTPSIPSSTPAPRDPRPSATPEVVASETHAVADAGSVTIAGTPGGLVVTDTTTADGWTAVVERDQGREVEVAFRSGGARVDFHAEIEDGRVRTRIRDRGAGEAASLPAEDATRRDEDDDRSGRGGGGDDHDDHDTDDHDDTDDRGHDDSQDESHDDSHDTSHDDTTDD